MSLKNHNRQFLRSEGKGQDERNLNQTRIYKPMPSLVNQPLLFAFCAAGLFYTSQGLGFNEIIFPNRKKGKGNQASTDIQRWHRHSHARRARSCQDCKGQWCSVDTLPMWIPRPRCTRHPTGLLQSRAWAVWPCSALR